MHASLVWPLAVVAAAMAMPVSAQQTHAGTPSGTVHSSMTGTQTRTADPHAQQKRLARHRQQVKRADAVMHREARTRRR